MHEYRLHTLVDITDHGNLKRTFPFTSNAGVLINDKNSLSLAKNQHNNFSTMLQILQMRGNITWEQSPQKVDKSSITRCIRYLVLNV